VGLLIDSSVFIEAERGRLALEPKIEGRRDEPVALSALTASELLHGVHRASSTRRRLERERFVEAILLRFPVVEFGLEAARIHARIWADLVGRGGLIGAHDLVIASTALAIGYSLATANPRDFTRIPGLRVEVWGS